MSKTRSGEIYLVIGRQFHSCDTVDMLFDLGKEVIPATDQLALVLVVDEIQFIASPYFTDLSPQIISLMINSFAVIYTLHTFSQSCLAKHLKHLLVF